MKTTKKNLDESKLEFTVILDDAEIKHAHTESVARLVKNVKVKGFREGKVPKEVAEKAINPAELADEEINHAVNDALAQIVRENNLQILDQPKIEITKFVPAQAIEFKATMEIVPELKLPDFAKITVKKEAAKVSDEEISRILENLRQGQATKEKVERAAKNGDEAEIDFEGFLDEKKTDAFDGGKGEKYPLVLGSGSFIPGFEEQIVGHKKNDEFDVKVSFPGDYGAKNLAGKAVVFAVKLREIREIKLPELNDDFAKNMAPDLKTLADLKNDIKRELTERAETEVENKFQNDLLNAVAAKTKFAKVPEILVNDQLQGLENEFATNLMYRGMTLEQYLESAGKTHEKWVETELKPAAETRVKNSMILAQLAREWNISASNDEVASKQGELMAQYSRPELRENLKQPEMVQQIAQQVITEKTLRELVKKAAK
jgi:trigger factor